MSGCSRRWARTRACRWTTAACRDADRAQGRALRVAGRGRRDAVSRRRRLHPRGRRARCRSPIASGALTHEIDDVLERAGLRDRCSRSWSAPIRPSAASRIPEPYLTAFAQLRAALGPATSCRGDRWRSKTRSWGLVSARGADLRCVAVTNTYSDSRTARRRRAGRARPARADPRRPGCPLCRLRRACQVARGPDRRRRRPAGPRPGRAGVPGRAHRVSEARSRPVPRSARTSWATRRSTSSPRIRDTTRRSRARIDAVNRYLFGELGFTGNREQYDDPRNSCLNEVMDRKKGIPITMALVYIEVARRAGLRAEGVNFPGHFLVRVLQDLHTGDPGDGLIVDPFHGGAILNEARLPPAAAAARRRGLGVRAVATGPGDAPAGAGADADQPEAALREDALVPAGAGDHRRCCWRCSRRRWPTSGTGACSPTHERLLARAAGSRGVPQAGAPVGAGRRRRRKETEQVWEHVKTLRRRVAQLN